MQPSSMVARTVLFRRERLALRSNCVESMKLARCSVTTTLTLSLLAWARASEAQPSLDIYATESLDLLRNWHHNKSESQIMQAVELKYASTMQALRKADGAFDSANINALKEGGKRTAELGIYESTRRIMLDSASFGELRLTHTVKLTI